MYDIIDLMLLLWSIGQFLEKHRNCICVFPGIPRAFPIQIIQCDGLLMPFPVTACLPMKLGYSKSSTLVTNSQRSTKKLWSLNQNWLSVSNVIKVFKRNQQKLNLATLKQFRFFNVLRCLFSKEVVIVKLELTSPNPILVISAEQLDEHIFTSSTDTCN